MTNTLDEWILPQNMRHAAELSERIHAEGRSYDESDRMAARYHRCGKNEVANARSLLRYGGLPDRDITEFFYLAERVDDMRDGRILRNYAVTVTRGASPKDACGDLIDMVSTQNRSVLSIHGETSNVSVQSLLCYGRFETYEDGAAFIVRLSSMPREILAGNGKSYSEKIRESGKTLYYWKCY